jgi:hypothetical protein
MNGYVLVEDLMDKLYTSCKQSEAGERLASDLAKALAEEIHPAEITANVKMALRDYEKAVPLDTVRQDINDPYDLSNLGRFSQ